MSKYFANIHTTDALKKAYKELCLKLHPDKGGNAADFIAMKDEYKEAAKRVAWEEAHSTDEATKKRNTKKDGTQKTAEEILEEQEQFAEVLEKLLGLDGLQLEICGSWLWITGNTYQYKAQIKEAGCQFASKKKAWYWHAGEWVRKIRKTFTMDEIRSLHGSEIIQNAGTLKIVASH